MQEIRETHMRDQNIRIETVTLIWNPSENLFWDLWETFQLNAAETNVPKVFSSFWAEVMDFVVDKVTGVAEVIRDALVSVMFERLELEKDQNVHLEIHAVAQYRLLGGNGVLLVAHSEGNLFMNLAYDLFSEEEKRFVHLVSIASPANVVGDFVGHSQAPYVTRTDDAIIGNNK